MDKKALKLNYKLADRPMGAFQIRNLRDDKGFVGVSENLGGIFNRIEFQLKANVHLNKPLQTDWNELCAEKFAFEILELLEMRENLDLKKELEFLEDLWLEKLKPYGEKGYNQLKKSRTERLQMITEKNRISWKKWYS